MKIKNQIYHLSIPLICCLILYATNVQSSDVKISLHKDLHYQELMQQDTPLSQTKNLDEVVVVGYGTQSKALVSGAITTLDKKLIEKRPIVDVGQALQGNATGVQVTSPSGKPGNGVSIRIRGASSISGGNEPLYVIDGIPTTDASSVSPSDIESISVLKDASSASIYGSRASNGVILITTKSGSGDKVKIGLNMYYGLSVPTHFIDMLGNKDYQSYVNEAYNNPKFVSDSLLALNNNDWQDMLYRTGSERNVQLNMSRGDKKNNYYFSLGYQDQVGTVKPSGFERFSARLNFKNTVRKWLAIGGTLSYGRNKISDVTDNASSGRGGFVLAALTTPRHIAKYTSTGQIGVNPNSGWENPFGSTEGKYDRNVEDRILANTHIDINVLPNLLLKSSWSVDYSDRKYMNYVDPWKTSDGRGNRGSAFENFKKNVTWLSEQTANYEMNTGKHRFSALAGFSVQANRFDENKTTVSRFAPNPVTEALPEESIETWISRAANADITNSRSASEWGLMSLLSRVSYSYDLKYMITANFRMDQSSKFLENNRIGYFPSISAGWIISKESFFEKMLDVANELKLRVGYGITGNQEGIGAYDKYSRVSYANGTSSVSYIAAEDLTWEKTTQYNAGIDVGFLQSRVALSVDFYHKTTNDVLVNFPLPSGAVSSDVFLNIGSVENYGFEFNVNTKNIQKEELSWTSNLNISTNKNRVKSLVIERVTGGVYERDDVSLLRAGEAMGTFYGYVYQGVDPATGSAKYADLNSDGVIDAADRTIIGKAQPDFIFGFTNNLNYKNWSLSLFLQGSYGNQIFNAARIETEDMVNSKNQSTRVLRRWKKAGDITDIPAASITKTTNSSTSSRFIEDGSYLRVKAITLTYSLPQQLLKRLMISNASIYFTAQNLLTLTSYLGYDPEVSSYENGSNTQTEKSLAQGIDKGAYPQIQSFVLGINVNF